MSIVDALKKLVVAFGGASEPEEVPGANVADVIEELAKNPPSGGGVGPVILHRTIEEIADPDDPESSITIARLDKTYREIEEVFLSGKLVFLYTDDPDTNSNYHELVVTLGFEDMSHDPTAESYYFVRSEEGIYKAVTKDDYPGTVVQ